MVEISKFQMMKISLKKSNPIKNGEYTKNKVLFSKSLEKIELNNFDLQLVA